MNPYQIDLTGRVALVTGSTRGIGYEIARGLASVGATIVVSGRNQEAADASAAKIRGEFANAQVTGLALEVTNAESAAGAIKLVTDTYGKIDILVNNAGITADNLLLRMSEDEWHSVLTTNLDSVFLMTKAVVRPMLRQRSGRIINISSVVGLMGNAGQANYAAAKAGMIGFSKTVAREFGAKGITCNVVAPGYIQTDMIASLPTEYLDNIMSMIPQKRIGTPEDVAKAVVFLASDLACYITGQVIQTDGGILM
jgi:3-oxoacyl-[acyl-carrier protein] reductase